MSFVWYNIRITQLGFSNRNNLQKLVYLPIINIIHSNQVVNKKLVNKPNIIKQMRYGYGI